VGTVDFQTITSVDGYHHCTKPRLQGAAKPRYIVSFSFGQAFTFTFFSFDIAHAFSFGLAETYLDMYTYHINLHDNLESQDN
jgi:hypothetical protein